MKIYVNQQTNEVSQFSVAPGKPWVTVVAPCDFLSFSEYYLTSEIDSITDPGNLTIQIRTGECLKFSYAVDTNRWTASDSELWVSGTSDILILAYSVFFQRKEKCSPENSENSDIGRYILMNLKTGVIKTDDIKNGISSPWVFLGAEDTLNSVMESIKIVDSAVCSISWIHHNDDRTWMVYHNKTTDTWTCQNNGVESACLRLLAYGLVFLESDRGEVITGALLKNNNRNVNL